MEVSSDYHFDFDAVSLRVKARVGCGDPRPEKAIRKLVGHRAARDQRRQAMSQPTGTADPIRAVVTGDGGVKPLLDALAAAGVTVDADDQAALQQIAAAGPDGRPRWRTGRGSAWVGSDST